MKSINFVQKISKWLLTTTSVFTMVMFPVTQGQAAQNEVAVISKAKAQSIIQTLGLNKSITFGDFYKKNKHLYPKEIQSQLDGFVEKNKNYIMPQFEVTAAKNSSGVEIASVRASKDGELINMQLFGESEKYVKFNHTNLTEANISNFKEMFVRLYNHDATLRKQLEQPKSASEKQFTGFPSLTKDVWSKMSGYDKAEYILNMRQLWSDAQKVLILKDPKYKRKTSQFEFLLNSFFETAQADPPQAKKSKSSKVEFGSTATSDGKKCLIAGYVSEYVNGSCGIKSVLDSYAGQEIVQKAQAQCPGELACNPYIYGMPNGRATCVSNKRNRDQFQKATHADGPCDTASPLGTKIEFLNNPDLKNKDRYNDSNLKLKPEQLKEEYKKQQSQNTSYVENYLKGFLSAGIDFTKEIGEGDLTEILKVQARFNLDIENATRECKEAAKSNTHNETNFWGACDQLQRRFLFVGEFLSQKPGCKDGSAMNSTTLKCACADPQKTEVNPGAKCPVVAVVAPVLPAPPEKDPVVEKPAPPEKPIEVCDGTIEKSASGAEVCVPNKADSNKKDKPEKKEEKSWFTGLFDKILPWVIGGIALFAFWKIATPSKPVLNQPADACPSGNCAMQCSGSMANINGVCACPSCPPGQFTTNAQTCTCNLVSVTNSPTDVVCADGVTRVQLLTQCPASTTTYTCWNGTQVQFAINCPEKPATTPATKIGK